MSFNEFVFENKNLIPNDFNTLKQYNNPSGLVLFCRTQSMLCYEDKNKQFHSIEECVETLRRKPQCNGDILKGDTLGCRSVHFYTAYFDRDTHCNHTGRYHEVCSHCDDYQKATTWDTDECIETCSDIELYGQSLCENVYLIGCDATLETVFEFAKAQNVYVPPYIALLPPMTPLSEFCPKTCETCIEHCNNNNEKSASSHIIPSVICFLWMIGIWFL
jgi:hypothetical protein